MVNVPQSSPPNQARVDLRRLCVVVTCMGRLAFLRRSLPSVLVDFPGTYCLVDYGCPEHSGDWVERECKSELAEGRIFVVRVTGVDEFHKTDALNRGARYALGRGARFLVFLDADSLVGPGFWPWLREHWDPAEFLIASLDSPRSLFGVLLVSAQDFVRVGGYDETFRGWGNEDLEMRLRLYLVGRLGYDHIPKDLLSAIAHDDELRTRHYSEKNKLTSFAKSWAYTLGRVWAWTGKSLRDLGPELAPLMQALPPDSAASDAGAEVPCGLASRSAPIMIPPPGSGPVARAKSTGWTARGWGRRNRRG